MNPKISERRKAQRAEELNTKFLVGIDVVAEMLDISERSAFRLKREGMPSLARGRYYLPDVAQWAFARAKQRPAGPREPTPWDMLQRAQLEKCALEVAQKRATLLPAHLVHELFALMAEAIGEELERTADVAGELVTLGDPQRIQARLHARTRETRRATAGRLAALAADVATGEAFEAAEG